MCFLVALFTDTLCCRVADLLHSIATLEQKMLLSALIGSLNAFKNRWLIQVSAFTSWIFISALIGSLNAFKNRWLIQVSAFTSWIFISALIGSLNAFKNRWLIQVSAFTLWIFISSVDLTSATECWRVRDTCVKISLGVSVIYRPMNCLSIKRSVMWLSSIDY